MKFSALFLTFSSVSAKINLAQVGARFDLDHDPITNSPSMQEDIAAIHRTLANQENSWLYSGNQDDVGKRDTLYNYMELLLALIDETSQNLEALSEEGHGTIKGGLSDFDESLKAAEETILGSPDVSLSSLEDLIQAHLEEEALLRRELVERMAFAEQQVSEMEESMGYAR